jgi:polysaccharide export outer membrane protein
MIARISAFEYSRVVSKNTIAGGRRRAFRALASLVLLLAACSQGADLPVLTSAGDEAYHLGVDDQIRITTYGEDQLSDDCRVDSSGNIALPLLGTVHAVGLTTEQLTARLKKRLEDQRLLRNPGVSVEITAYRPIYIIGEVSHPGSYPYQPNMTMLTAVAVAGGFTYRGVQSYAYVVRQTDGSAIEGRLLPQSLVQPGDAIKVYERRF